jgi:hypothetical protein
MQYSENEKQRQIKNSKIHACLLGVRHRSEAINILNKLILISLAQQNGFGKCSKCLVDITVQNMTISHKQPWRKCWSRYGDANLFWDIDNIDLQCKQCNTTDDNSRYVGRLGDIKEIDYKENANVKNPTMRTQLNFDRELLGMDFGKANHQLRKKIMVEWANKLNLCVCHQCKKPIVDPDDFSIEHIKPWMSGETDEEKRQLFYSLDNIAFSHHHCNAAAANIGKGISGYNGVTWYTDKRKGVACWRAMLRIKGKALTVRYCEDPIRAAEAYDMAVMKYRNGEGILNFPEKIEQYKQEIADGFHEYPKCKVCGKPSKHRGYCRVCYYRHGGGREKRLQRYKEGKG